MNASELIKNIEAIRYTGDPEQKISKVCAIKNAHNENQFLTWCNIKNLDKIKELKNGCVLVPNTKIVEHSKNLVVIYVENPRRSFQVLVNKFFVKAPAPAIHSKATVATSAMLGFNVNIGANVVIMDNCKIGNHSSIEANTVLFPDTTIGNNVKIGANCTIGGTGFGYEKNENDKFELIPHLSCVVIEDDVEIGNNTCIDRGVLDPTHIKKNVKIDNLVHIAHGVVIEENSMIIANSMIAGSVMVGKNSWIAPSSSIKNGLSIGENSFVGLGAVVLKDVKENTIVVGNPACTLIK